MGKKGARKPKVIPVSTMQKEKKNRVPEAEKENLPAETGEPKGNKSKEVKEYQIKGTNLLHNGKMYRENFFIRLTDSEAEPLNKILVLKK